MYHKLKKLKLFNFPLKINYKIKRKNIYIDRYIYICINTFFKYNNYV